MDSEALAEMMDYLHGQEDFAIHSLLIIRNGYVVADATFWPFTQDSLHDIASDTKSFTSSLIGIAIDKGYIESVEQPVLDFFSERTVANLDANKGAMTLEDLLTMRSGFDCNNARVDAETLTSADWVQFALDLPTGTEPGTRWVYCNANVHILSAVISETTGMNALAFAREHLFEPLGVSDVIWLSDPDGHNVGSAYMRLNPDDMAKLGYLFLNNGEWDGQQVVSAEWVEQATNGPNYGYLWYVGPAGAYYEAAGSGGQEIYVLPDENMVVVMTGATGGGGSGGWGQQLLNSHVLPAAESDAPLPPNPNGVASLKSQVEAAAAPEPIQSKPVPPLSEIAQHVAGNTYVLEDNPSEYLSFTLSFPTKDEAVLEMTTRQAGTDPRDPEFQWRLGLDGVPRVTPGRLDFPTSATGSWETDNIFLANIEEIGNWEWASFRLRFTFGGDQAEVEAWQDGLPVATISAHTQN
jgi:CubicO group peptidase (beta-lactamase class C family)